MFSTRVKINKIIIKLGGKGKNLSSTLSLVLMLVLIHARFIRFINVTRRGNVTQTTNNSLLINSNLSKKSLIEFH